MALATLIHGPESMRIPHTPGSAVAAGEIVVVGSLVCVAERPIAANVAGELLTAGQANFPKATGSSTAVTAGEQVFWDASGGVLSDDPADGKQVGQVVVAAADADATARVIFYPCVFIAPA